MRARSRGVLRAAVVGTLALAALSWTHELLARQLASMGLLEQLLSPTADALVALVAALALYSLRAILFVVGPALMVTSVLRAAAAGSASRRAADSTGPAPP